ncbi:hypothetical protein [Phenylobacterium sp.]|uniref:hypothetical protein n=1 Tax=Phenylobacterium sp. TaxID=1871053 RepID=UPI0035622101
MDIHKPKPWRGLREFLKEIGTIVIGVLIALGGEQAVEAMHWRHQAQAGEAALQEAFVREVDNAALREAQDACVTERLAALSAILQRGTESGRLPPIGAIGHPSFTPWTVGAWGALVADQTVSHLPRSKAIAYTAIVQQTAYLSGLSDREEDQWALLDSMVGPGRRLSDVEAEQLRITLAAASDSNLLMHRTSARLRDAVKETGLVEAPRFAAAAKQARDNRPNAAICRPIAASRPLTGG